MAGKAPTTSRWRAASFAVIVLLLAPIATAADAATRQQGETEIFRGIVAAMGTMGTGANTSLNMHITSWTSPTQRQVLLNALREGTGETGLFNVLSNQPEKGFLDVRRGQSIRLKYAWQKVADDGSREITLIADNLLPGWATMEAEQYSVVHLQVDADGNGTGSASPAATIRWDAEDQRIKVGIESTEAMRITSVRKVQ